MKITTVSFNSPIYGSYLVHLNDLGGVLPRVGDYVDGEIFDKSFRLRVESITFKLQQNIINVTLREISF